ncbi:N-acetylmuramoyl-L-alanine amidase [Candidatus Sumerlaeota bacterium]|nr:N-acetylmuramoyl-L-alanine amidase [Candidatus Sumerlaeota bacterium]
MAVLTLISSSRSLAGVLAESDIGISSAKDHDRVEIRLGESAVVRVVDEVAEYKRFFIDLYSTEPGFPDRVIPLRNGILRGLQTIAYPDSKVLRIIFHTTGSVPFRVADAETAVPFPATSVSDTGFARLRPTSRHLVVDVSRGGYPLPDLKPVGLRPLRPGGGAKRLVILDPGHGGADPGAKSIVTFGGRKLEEKDVVLSVAREVYRLLNKSPVVTAVMTRDDDREMSLEDRVAFAEKTDGDLFVSIHANSTKYHGRRDARGIEFYYLGETSDPALRQLEMAENLVDRSSLNKSESEHWDLIWKNMVKDNLDMQRPYGLQVANLVNEVFTQDVYFKSYNRGVKSARFRVLMNPVMPSVLVEIGYLDHPREVRNLAQPAFQQRIAKLIANGILEYFSQLDSELEFYQYEMN